MKLAFLAFFISYLLLPKREQCYNSKALVDDRDAMG